MSQAKRCTGSVWKSFGWLSSWLGIDPTRLAPLPRAALAISGALLAVTAGLSLADVLDYAGVDFRNRVVGARVLLLGQDPYTFHWRPGMPESLLDPGFDGRFPIHRLTVPPTVLCAYLPFASLPYAVQRVLSWAFEWSAMAWSLVLLTRTLPNQRGRLAFFLVASYLLVACDFWRQHVERGQVYVFHLVLLSAGVSLGLRCRLDSWRAGMWFGLAAALRPNFIVLAPAFLVLGKPRTAGGTALAFAASVLLTFPLASPSVWRHYAETGDLYYLAAWDPDRLPPFAPPPKEQWIEGYDFSRELSEVHSTAFPFFYQRSRGPLGWPVFDVGAACKTVLVLLALWLLALLFRRPRRYSGRLALGLMMVFLIDMEYFLPNRWTYVDVMFFLPLALFLPTLRVALRSSAVPVGLLVAGALLSGGPWLRHASFGSRPGMVDTAYFAALVRSLLVMGTFTGLALDAWRSRLRSPPSAAAKVRAAPREPAVAPSPSSS